MTFSDVVEAVRSLSTPEKEAMQLLLQQYLREERREEMYENFQAARVEQEGDRFRFSASLTELKRKLHI